MRNQQNSAENEGSVARTGSPKLIVKIAFEMENSSIILLSDDDDIIFVDEKKAPRRNRNRDGDSPAAAADDDGASDDCIFVPTRTLNKERRNNAAVKYDNPLPSTSHAQDTTKTDSDTDLWSMLDSSPLVVSSHIDSAAVIGNNKSDNGGRISPPPASVCDNPATSSSASVSSGSLQILLTDSMAAAAMDSPVVTVSVVGKPKPSPPSHAIWRAFAPDTSPPAKDTSPDTPPSTNRNKSQYYVSGTDDSDSGGGSPADNKVCTVDLQQLSSDKTDDSVLIANQPDSAVASTSAYTFTTTYTTNTDESVTAAAACPATGVKYIDDTSPIQILPYPDADNEASDSDDSVVFIESRTKSRRGMAKIKTEDSDGGRCAVIIPDSQPMDTGSPIICSSDDKSSKDQPPPPHSFFDSITLDMKPFGSMFTSSSSSSKDADNKNGVLSSNSASSSTVNLASLGDHATMATRAKSASAIKSPLDDLRAFTTLTSFNVSTVSSSTNYDTKPPIKLKFTKSLSVPGTSSSKSMPVDAHDLKSRLERIAKKAERKKHKRSRTLSGHKLPAFMIKKGSLFPRHRSFSVPDSSTSPGAQTGDGNSAFTPYQKYRKRKLPPSNIKAILYHSNHPEKQQQDDGTNGIQQDLSTMAHGANGLSPQKPFFDPFYTNIPFKKRNFIGGCGPGSQGNQVTPQVLAVPSLSTSLGRPSAPIASTAGNSSSSIAAAQSAADADADKAINDVLMSIRGLKNSSKDPMFGAGPMSTYSQAGGSRPGPHHQPVAAPSSAPAPVSLPVSLTFGKAPSASAASASFSSIASAALSASLASARAAHTATAISAALSPASVTFAAPAVQQQPPQLLSAVDRANAAADENQYTCKKCENLTLAQEITRCTSWHSCCQMCIQKEVTNLLAVDRSNKRALKCVYPNCDSLYTIAELKRALPPLLVDILEKRLEADIADQVIGFNDSATTPDFGKVEEIIETKGGGPSLVKLPGYWEPMDPEDTGYQKVVLDHTLSEYIMVTDMFKQTMPPTEFRITKVSRIQNPVLYQFYCVKKSQLKKEGEDNRVREQLLFHGTVKNVVEGICKNNIDWRLSGKNATAFGKGSYFARDAKFSHNYTDGAKATIHGGLRNRIHRYVTHHHAMSTSGGGLSSIPLLPLNLASHQIPMLAQMPPAGAASILGLQINNNIPPLPGTGGGGVAMPPSNHDTSTEASSSHVLFLAHVLVGKYTLGNPSYRKPPALNGHEPYGKAYDSCVNDMRHPSIFVVFESAQIYPEYMIEYTSA